MMDKNVWTMRLVIHSILIVSLFVCMYPFFYMVNNSLKTGMEILNYPFSLPRLINVSGYLRVIRELNITRLIFNSFYVAISVSLLNVVLNSMVAYGLEKIPSRYNAVFFKVILFTMMIPPILLLIPSYMFLFHLGWKNTYRVLIIPMAISPYNIFLFKQFFKQIHPAYSEAAKIDGASHWKIYRSIILPMSAPVVSIVAILSFMGSWNDFLNPLLYISDQKLFTIQLGVAKFRSLIPGTNLQAIYAGTVFATAPIIVFYLIFRNQFVKAYTGTALKM